MNDSPTLYCANHPQRETSLRCNQCDKPICSRCAVRTPTGYRCRECISGQQRIFETALTIDFILAFPIAAVLSMIASFFITRIGFFAILLGPVAGTVIAEIVRSVTRKRRSKNLFLVATSGVIAGCLPVAIMRLFMFSLPALIYLLIFAGLAASTLYYRLSGISIKY